ncbi:MAG TPA: type II toxin-antitoxin system prevent-host-death family antitoxin [Mycobacteriales bacterium]|nr:type II toxin-antitoxin system prevent-host-death family antitoxin [Mycobacteriales bacterium]
MTIGIRELRQHASRYVRMAKDGQRVAVTERGHLVAYLVPSTDKATLVERMIVAGEYEPAVGSILDLLPPPVAPAGTRPLSEVVREMRDEERW